MQKISAVLVFGGHDPSGGAGIGADTQTIGDLGYHAVSVVTAITAQNTHGVLSYQAIEPELVEAQGRALVQDAEIVAIKTGMLVNESIVKVVCNFIDQCPGIPVVVDPVFASGSGHPLADASCAPAILRCLVPRAAVLTPNISECHALVSQHPHDDLDIAATALLEKGCQSVLVTGTDGSDTDDVIHWHYHTPGDQAMEYRFPRLPYDYHGSGCTLASALSVYLTRNDAIAPAIQSALDYTWQTLKEGYAISDGQRIPQRRVTPGRAR